MVIRYNPRVGSSNPVGQVLLRCNWDVQCTDRVHVLLDESEEVDLEALGKRDEANLAVAEEVPQAVQESQAADAHSSWSDAAGAECQEC